MLCGAWLVELCRGADVSVRLLTADIADAEGIALVFSLLDCEKLGIELSIFEDSCFESFCDEAAGCADTAEELAACGASGSVRLFSVKPSIIPETAITATAAIDTAYSAFERERGADLPQEGQRCNSLLYS